MGQSYRSLPLACQSFRGEAVPGAGETAPRGGEA